MPSFILLINSLNEQHKYILLLSQLTEYLRQIESEIQAITERRHYLNEIVETSVYESLQPADLALVETPLANRSALLASLSMNSSLIENLEAGINQSSSVEESLDRIVTLAGQYVLNIDTNHCPICSTEFESMKALMNRIEQQKSSNTRTGVLLAQLEDIKAQNEKITQQLSLAQDAINRVLTIEMELGYAALTELQFKKDRLSNDLKDAQNAYLHSDGVAERYLIALRESIPGEVQSETDLTQMEEVLSKRLHDVEILLSRLDLLISKKSKLIWESENRLTINKNRITSTENNIDLSKTDKNFQNANLLIEGLNLQFDELDEVQVQSHLVHRTEKCVHLKIEITHLNEKANKIKDQIGTL